MRASLSKTKQNKKASNTHKSEQFLSAGVPLCVLSHVRWNHPFDPQFESLHSASLSKPRKFRANSCAFAMLLEYYSMKTEIIFFLSLCFPDFGKSGNLMWTLIEFRLLWNNQWERSPTRIKNSSSRTLSSPLFKIYFVAFCVTYIVIDSSSVSLAMKLPFCSVMRVHSSCPDTSVSHLKRMSTGGVEWHTYKSTGVCKETWGGFFFS